MYDSYRYSIQSYYCYSGGQYIVWYTPSMEGGFTDITYVVGFGHATNNQEPVDVYINDSLKFAFSFHGNIESFGKTSKLFDGSGGYRVMFVNKKSLTDEFGVLYLTVPSVALSPGGTTKIGFVRTGSTSSWIMVHSFTDMVNYERMGMANQIRAVSVRADYMTASRGLSANLIGTPNISIFSQGDIIGYADRAWYCPNYIFVGGGLHISLTGQTRGVHWSGSNADWWIRVAQDNGSLDPSIGDLEIYGTSQSVRSYRPIIADDIIWARSGVQGNMVAVPQGPILDVLNFNTSGDGNWFYGSCGSAFSWLMYTGASGAIAFMDGPVGSAMSFNGEDAVLRAQGLSGPLVYNLARPSCFATAFWMYWKLTTATNTIFAGAGIETAGPFMYLNCKNTGTAVSGLFVQCGCSGYAFGTGFSMMRVFRANEWHHYIIRGAIYQNGYVEVWRDGTYAGSVALSHPSGLYAGFHQNNFEFGNYWVDYNGGLSGMMSQIHLWSTDIPYEEIIEQISPYPRRDAVNDVVWQLRNPAHSVVFRNPVVATELRAGGLGWAQSGLLANMQKIGQPGDFTVLNFETQVSGGLADSGPSGYMWSIYSVGTTYAPKFVPGVVGSAISFPKTSAALKLYSAGMSGASGLMFEAWMFTKRHDGNPTPFFQLGSQSVNPFVQMLIHGSGGLANSLCVQVGASGYLYGANRYIPSVFIPEEWHHYNIVVQLWEPTGHIYAYRDGMLIGSTAVSHASGIRSPLLCTQAILGNYEAGYVNGFSGMMDEVRLTAYDPTYADMFDRMSPYPRRDAVNDVVWQLRNPAHSVVFRNPVSATRAYIASAYIPSLTAGNVFADGIRTYGTSVEGNLMHSENVVGTWYHDWSWNYGTGLWMTGQPFNITRVTGTYANASVYVHLDWSRHGFGASAGLATNYGFYVSPVYNTPCAFSFNTANNYGLQLLASGAYGPYLTWMSGATTLGTIDSLGRVFAPMVSAASYQGSVSQRPYAKYLSAMYVKSTNRIAWVVPDIAGRAMLPLMLSGYCYFGGVTSEDVQIHAYNGAGTGAFIEMRAGTAGDGAIVADILECAIHTLGEVTSMMFSCTAGVATSMINGNALFYQM